jgi:hypothetical protein
LFDLGKGGNTHSETDLGVCSDYGGFPDPHRSTRACTDQEFNFGYAVRERKAKIIFGCGFKKFARTMVYIRIRTDPHGYARIRADPHGSVRNRNIEKDVKDDNYPCCR